MRILSIDGGGIRGIIPAMVLAAVEANLGRAISEVFDLVAGTSTGGIIALALTMPEDGKPAWRAEQLVELYEKEGTTIFPRSPWPLFRTVQSAFDARYSAKGIEEVLLKYFGEARLKDALTPVIVSSYELESRQPFFFKSAKAKANPANDFLMRDVARATSAAPTYFEPCQLKTSDPVGYYTLVDGGVFANNPSMCAWAEASSDGTPADVRLLSLGTGELCRPLHYGEVKDWGLLHWARPILNVVMDGVSDATHYQLGEMLGSARYLRITHTLDIAKDDMDDASTTNLHALKVQAQRLIDEHGDELFKFCA